MSRWEPNARDRLEQAALQLFREQGFADTTVPQITARAGLTTRTFFRHFADKREVLFAGEEELPALVASMMAEAPAELDPMTLIVQGLAGVVRSRFEGRRDYLRVRRSVVRTDAGLVERELRKLSDLADAVELGFR
ncbi:TetR/AcrR family transcriptional regulator, partial [Actinoplanes sp. TFC3]|uniref:TetR/AcrR family transcriptional regulator n=1 Tax=Actinoplanes sp. TFC3 TaxID=1710355 RepID=UPI00082DF1F5